MREYKRLISFILSSVLILSCFTMSAFALDEADGEEAVMPAAEDVVETPEAAATEEEEADAEEMPAEETPSVTEEVTEEKEDVDSEAEETADETEVTVETKADPAAVEKVVFETTTSGVKVTAGKDFDTPEMTAIRFIDGTTVAKEVTDVAGITGTGVTVTGLTAGKLYKVAAVVDGNEEVIGYYINAAAKATGKSTSVSVSWKSVPAAEGVAASVKVYRDGTEVGSSSTTSYSDTTAVSGKVYTYTTVVFVTVEGTVYKAYASPAMKCKRIPKPAAVTLKAKKYKAAQYAGKGDSHVISPNQIKLTWNKVANATSYRIYRWDSKSGKYSLIKTTTGTVYTNKSLVNKRRYKYKVKAVNETAYGTVTSDYSNVVGKYKIKYHDFKCHAIWYKGVITANAKCFKTSHSKSVVRTVGKGTKVTVLERAGGRSHILLSNGKSYWVNRSKCHYTDTIYNSKKDWTNARKEAYVKNKKSKTKYLIWISQYTQRVNVFQKKSGSWKLIKTGLCATGKIERKTPMGTFKVFQKEKGWFYPGYKNAPVVHFAARNSFHSRPTYYSGKVKTKTIGKPASNGCCRLEQGYIDWIYKYIPMKTTVISW